MLRRPALISSLTHYFCCDENVGLCGTHFEPYMDLDTPVTCLVCLDLVVLCEPCSEPECPIRTREDA